jgi:antitoxin component HigA of HigAB toxin-antitoxin module
MSTTYEDLLQEILPRPITSERAYRRALGQIEHLLRKPKKTRAEDDMIELLATLVEQFEIRQGYTDPVLSPRDRLAGLLEARHMTQTELSQATDVPRTAINEVLGGKRAISKTNAVRLAKFFGVPIGELIAGGGA